MPIAKILLYFSTCHIINAIITLNVMESEVTVQPER